MGPAARRRRRRRHGHRPATSVCWTGFGTRLLRSAQWRLDDRRYSGRLGHCRTWATPALEAGVPAKVVSERLGHANITIDVYSHICEAMDTGTAERVASVDLRNDGWESARRTGPGPSA